jgi:uncharacterized protein YdgA (DUF945 family)
LKKILIFAVSIILLTAVIAPKIVANSFNQQLDSIVELVKQNPAYSAVIKDRTSAWFSSTATINISLDTNAFAQDADPEVQEMFADMNVDVVIEAQHGPILSQNGLALGWLSWNAKVDGNSFRDTLVFEDNSAFYQITGHTSLFGLSNFTDQIPSFKMKDEEIFTQFTFSGWNGSGSFSDSKASYQGLLKNINANSAFGKFELNQWSVDSNVEGNLMQAFGGSFYDSTASMLIQDITFEQATDQTKTTLTKLGMDVVSDFDETTSLLDLQANYSLQDLTTKDFNLSSVMLNTQVNNLQEQFFKAYQNLMSELSQEPEQMQQNLKNFMQTNLLGQLQAEPEFNISSFKAKINQGNITGSLNSKIQQVTELPEAIESPEFWLQHLLVDAQINADQSAALWLAVDTIKTQIKADPNAANMTDEEITTIAQQQATSMLQGMQQQGMFTETSTGYQVLFSLKDGQALLNGNPMPLPIGQQQ